MVYKIFDPHFKGWGNFSFHLRSISRRAKRDAKAIISFAWWLRCVSCGIIPNTAMVAEGFMSASKISEKVLNTDCQKVFNLWEGGWRLPALVTHGVNTFTHIASRTVAEALSYSQQSTVRKHQRLAKTNR